MAWRPLPWSCAVSDVVSGEDDHLVAIVIVLVGALGVTSGVVREDFSVELSPGSRFSCFCESGAPRIVPVLVSPGGLAVRFVAAVRARALNARRCRDVLPLHAGCTKESTMKLSALSGAALLCTVASLAPRVAHAQAVPSEEVEPTTAPPITPESAPAPAPPAPAEPAYRLTPLGYVEAHYAYNLNRPANGITNYRGFDNRHNTFTLANAVLGASADYGALTARLLLQYGSTPSTYYLGEPALAGTGGANASGSELWKYLQEANIAWRAPVGRGLLLQIGLVPSPIGAEAFAVKDNWNYSRSNLFFGLPFYHAGLRATYEWTDELSSTFAVFNGWNSVVDDNEEKSVQANLTYKIPQRLIVQALYFGGIERPASSRPEGPWWRHDFDLSAQYHATTWLSVMAQGNHGWEPNRIGTARWTAGAVYARVKPLALFDRFGVSASDRLYVAVRGDRFHEHLATDGRGRSSSPLFWGGVEWVSSVTGTVDVRPHDNLSVRFEYRHDVADAPLYFGRNVRGDGSAAAPYIPNARTQDTLLLGATAWF